MDKMNKSAVILVTGGNGYLGTELVKRLKLDNHQVFTISKDAAETATDFRISLSEIDRLKEVLQSVRPETVYHLAANIDRSRDFEVFPGMCEDNVIGTYNLLMSLPESTSHLIFTSTGEVYGNNISPFHEDMIPDPVSPYSLSKLMAENLIKTFCKTSKINYTLFRLFNFYGRNMPQTFFIAQMVNTILRGDEFNMTQGEQERDYLHIDDVCDAMVRSRGKIELFNGVFNLCSGKSIRMNEIAGIVERFMSSNDLLKMGTIPYRQSEIMKMAGNPDKLTAKIGDFFHIDINEGLKEFIAQQI